jgi:Na+-translocating ferredoxin:NAD+ oxidoreductase subunit E
MDALGMGLGFVFALFCLGAVRELLGNGTLFDIEVFPGSFQEWIIMILPAGGFFTLALWLLLFNFFKTKKVQA